MRVTVARAGLALLAVVLIAWFAALAVNDRIGHAASDRVVDDPDMGAAEWARTREDLRRAERLNPGTEWSMTLVGYLLLRGDRRGALEIAEDIVRREPDNLGAWAFVLRAAGSRDRRRSERAQAEIRRLNPLAGSRR